MVDWNNIKHGESLNKAQFDEIMAEIVKYHRFGVSTKKNVNCVNRYIKYIRPSWDMRDLKCFFIQFDYKEFDSRDSDDSMYDCIMKWLNEYDEDCEIESSENYATYGVKGFEGKVF
jgi:hypothetical protein